MRMQFGDYVFLANPVRLKVTYGKNMNLVCVPDVGSFAQNVGKAARVVWGKAVLHGESAWEEAQKLVALFDLSQGSRILVLPNGEMFFCYFSKLEVDSEGEKKAVSYCFEFVEDMLKEERSQKQYVAKKGDTLRQVALRNKVGVERILRKNPELLRKGKLTAGQEVIL